MSPPELAQLRQSLRAFLPNALAQWERQKAQSEDVSHESETLLQMANARIWQRMLFDAGWAGIAIPKEYGGRGEEVATQIAFNEESARAGVPKSVLFVAQFLVAPTLVQCGNEQHKGRHVRQTLMGEQVWCQLFSEPDAGSDLAGLRTSAARNGDRWIVNGQKVWSSSAHLADYGFLLARTDPSVPKHKGISAFILNMRKPGVVVRPLRKMGGGYGFNEVFFDNVVIADTDRIGEAGDGWKIAMAALAHERLGLIGQFRADLSGLVALAKKQFPDPAERPEFVRAGIAGLYARSLAINALGQATAAILSQGGSPGPRGSVGKLMLGSLMNDAADLALRIQGHPDGALREEDAPFEGAWQAELLEHPARRISGGSDQIQRGIIAERILGFPRTRAAG